jgi:hypothetical protein
MAAMASSVEERGRLQMSQTWGSDVSLRWVGRPVSAKAVGDGEGRVDCALLSDDDDSFGRTKLR